MAQMRLNSDGERETLKTDDWLALRERLRAVWRSGAGQGRHYLRVIGGNALTVAVAGVPVIVGARNLLVSFIRGCEFYRLRLRVFPKL